MSIERKIGAVINDLGVPTPQQLNAVIRTLQVSVEELTGYLEPPGIRPYARRRLGGIDNLHVEVLVMNWASRVECAPHDHGDSFGSFLVVAGETTERRYEFTADLQLLQTGSTSLSTGEVVEAPLGLIHSMVNPSTAPLVTLHFYAPPIKTMRVFAPERCRGCVVAECGAWWPGRDQMIADFPMSRQL